MLAAVFPEQSWDPFRFQSLPRNYWNDVNNQRSFLERIAPQLNVSTLEDWHSIKTKDVIRLGGAGLLSRYGDSLRKALYSIYPDHKWDEWKFHIPKNYWEKEDNIKSYLESLRRELGMTSILDWNSVSYKQIKSMQGSSLIKKAGGLIPLLNKYPLYN
jgi:hypothetical protein